jgi:hypothetical protein
MNELQKIYEDNIRRLTSATNAMQQYQALPNEVVRVYANRLKANWRKDGWNQIKVVQYDMACAGLQHAHHMNVRPWISSGIDKLDVLDKFFHFAVASEFKLDDKKPGGQQPQMQTRESHKGGDMKRNFGPSISGPAEHTSGNNNNSTTGNSNSVNSNRPSGGSRANYIQRCGYQRTSAKAEKQSGNVLAAAAETTLH